MGAREGTRLHGQHPKPEELRRLGGVVSAIRARIGFDTPRSRDRFEKVLTPFRVGHRALRVSAPPLALHIDERRPSVSAERVRLWSLAEPFTGFARMRGGQDHRAVWSVKVSELSQRMGALH